MIFSKIKFILYFFMLISSIYSVTVVRIATLPKESDTRNSYYIALLELALDKTANKYGTYEIKNIGMVGEQKRLATLLGNGTGDVDLMWTMTNSEREKIMLPIRIPLLKGLMGCRLLIINKNKKNIFEKINDVKDLKKLTAIQGHDWPDTDILIANGFKVEKATNYEGMFQMVESGRGDYFPRAIIEPFEELKLRPDLNLIVEEKIMLYYFSPIYFFTNINKPELKKRIEEGLKIAIADGSFDKLFYNHPSNKAVFDKINFKNMKVFKLNNPFLSEETKKIMNKKEYILKID